MNTSSGAILFLTLGASDLKPTPELVASGILPDHAFRPDRFDKSRHVFAAMRESTELLKDRPDTMGWMEYPICKPAVEYVKEEEAVIDRLIFVVTDQINDPAVEPYHIKGDSTFAADIIQAKIEQDFPLLVKNFEKISVTKNPADFSFMYDFFDQKLENSAYAFEEDKPVYLLAQGGIDGTNFSLTLKCIEKYPNLIQLSKPDGHPFAIVENTPQKFRNNYSKQRILKSLATYQYLAVTDEAYTEPMEKLAEFAFSCLSFDFVRARSCTKVLHKADNAQRGFYKRLDRHLVSMEKSQPRLREMYLSAKMAFTQGNYADFLIKIFSLSENVVKPEIHQRLGVEAKFGKDQTAWKDAINAQDGLKEYLMAHHQGYKNPNFWNMGWIIRWFAEVKGQPSNYLPLHSQFVALRNHRNAIAHSLEGINKATIWESLLMEKKGETENPIKDFFADLDAYFGVEGMGIYDEINAAIREML